MPWIDDVFSVTCLRSCPVILDPEKVIDPEALSNTVRPSLDEMAQWITDDLNLLQRMRPKQLPIWDAIRVTMPVSA